MKITRYTVTVAVFQISFVFAFRTDLPIGPPQNIDIIVPLSGGLILSWGSPETDATILGYKINYGNSERPPALVALDSTAAGRRSVFVRPDVFLKFGEAVTVVVWAYSARVEGEVLSVVVSPRGLVGKENYCILGFECDALSIALLRVLVAIGRKQKNRREYVQWHINMYASLCCTIVRNAISTGHSQTIATHSKPGMRYVTVMIGYIQWNPSTRDKFWVPKFCPFREVVHSRRFALLV